MKIICTSSISVAALLAMSFQSTAIADTAPIRIGYAAAITGPLATYDSVEGARCKVDQINDAGGVLGRKLVLEARDMKSDAVVSSVAGQELIDLGVSAILAPASDDTAIPIAALALPLGIPVVAASATQVQFPLASPTNSYLNSYGDNLAAGAIAEYAISKGYKNVALMVSRDFGAYGVVFPKYFADAFEHMGGKVVGSVNYNIGLSDYSAQIAEIKAMNPKPDIIVGGFIMPEGGIMPRQFKAANLDVKFVGSDGYDDPSLISIAGPGADLITFVTHGFPSEGSALKAFYDDCTKRGYKIPNIFFGLAGEAVLLVSDAITRARSAEPAKVNAALSETENFKGILSSSTSYKGRSGVPSKEMTILVIENGAFKPVGRILPKYVPAP